jgi:hypothetical protein
MRFGPSIFQSVTLPQSNYGSGFRRRITFARPQMTQSEQKSAPEGGGRPMQEALPISEVPDANALNQRENERYRPLHRPDRLCLERGIALGGRTTPSPTGVDPRLAAVLSDRISQNVDMVTARINYRFGGWGAPPVAARY